MTRPRRFERIAALTALLAASHAGAQQDATTLAAMSADATHIARVRVVATRPGEVRTVVFSTIEAIAGTPPATFELSEPMAGACGRALSGLAVGAGYVVFLADSSDLAFRSSRAIVRLEPGLVDHVRALSASAHDARARAVVLARGLSSETERIRDDAALALSICPDLEGADRPTAEALHRALESAFSAGDLRVLPSLMIAASRTGHPRSRELLIEHWVTGETPSLQRALRRAILRHRRVDVLSGLQRWAGADGPHMLRAQSLIAAFERPRSADAPPRFRSIQPTRGTR